MLAIFRSIMLVVGLLAFSQAPEFFQQYRQRLGGAVDELNRLVAQFDHDAAVEGLNREQALTSYQNSGSDFLTRRGLRMRDLLARQAMLAEHQRQIQQSGLIDGLLAIAQLQDRTVLQNSLAAYQMAVPITPDAILVAAAGACTGWVFGGIFGWVLTQPFRRYSRNSSNA